jgi:hypothetical protein
MIYKNRWTAWMKHIHHGGGPKSTNHQPLAGVRGVANTFPAVGPPKVSLIRKPFNQCQEYSIDLQTTSTGQRSTVYVIWGFQILLDFKSEVKLTFQFLYKC